MLQYGRREGRQATVGLKEQLFVLFSLFANVSGAFPSPQHNSQY